MYLTEQKSHNLLSKAEINKLKTKQKYKQKREMESAKYDRSRTCRKK